jgi:hypothetical protein
MSNLSRILMVVTIASVGVILAGCPEKNGDGEDTWIRQNAYSENGIASTDATIYKLYEDGRVTFVAECTFSATGWSAQLRAWVSGTYTISDGNISLSFEQAACQDLAAKIITRGNLSGGYAEYLGETLFDLQQIVYLLTQQPLAPVPYSVDGNTMYLGTDPYSRFEDSFDYTAPTWISCPR